MNPYEEHTERHWFVRDLRGYCHRCNDEEQARWELENNPNVVQALYRDIRFGPLVEVER